MSQGDEDELVCRWYANSIPDGLLWRKNIGMLSVNRWEEIMFADERTPVNYSVHLSFAAKIIWRHFQ